MVASWLRACVCVCVCVCVCLYTLTQPHDTRVLIKVRIKFLITYCVHSILLPFLIYFTYLIVHRKDDAYSLTWTINWIDYLVFKIQRLEISTIQN